MPRALDLLRAAHPGPTAVVTALAVALGIGAGATPAAVVLLGATILANQLSIGLANDAVDAELDRDDERSDKPIAEGRIGRRAVAVAAGIAAVLSVVLGLIAGPGVLAAQSVLLVAGWAYDLGLKRTWASPLPYAIGFAALPWAATSAAAPPHPASWWATVAAAALGTAAHFANVLPDLDDDRRHGIRGLPQTVGRAGSVVAALALLVAAAAALAIGSRSVPGSLAAAVTVVLAVAAGILSARGGGRGVFRLVMLAALVDAVALAIAGAG